MLYAAYEMQKAWLAGMGMAAQTSSDWLLSTSNPLAWAPTAPVMARALEVFAHSVEVRGKPAFGLHSTIVDGASVPVSEAVVLRKPFGQLKHFQRGVSGRSDPRILVVAPMSGHYATLLRGTVERLLPDHEVYITDWRDARAVPTGEGRFDLNDYVDYLIEFLELLGPDTHMLAVCQPSVPALAAVALMNEDGHPCTPPSLTLMGGPVDTRKAPTSVNELAFKRPFAWFEQTVIQEVPGIYPGAGRKVYPGYLQLSGFMSMNLANHMKSHWELFKHLVEGDEDSAEATKAFYDEYRAVCDMTAEFYLQTIDMVFQRQALATGSFTHRGRIADPAKITKTALLAIEGERDDISGIGQTRAALDLAVNLAADKKQYHLALGAGHYGIFNGSKWRDSIAPAVEAFVRTHDTGRVAPAPKRVVTPRHVEPIVPPGVEVA
ncbi:polyhydroxyalkanoate depolymerase [Sandarakinorhabdus oryzae]|uniref:polyhydroxyalkanoate depolymerase n=1 Tax=Sandarakinorhabdus oryzae TaxID=2675220 RepID=UPI0012E18C3D|nr:polyhydroxyalkanoate depolymerase [Sandarakinorhabdus oryzae]